MATKVRRLPSLEPSAAFRKAEGGPPESASPPILPSALVAEYRRARPTYEAFGNEVKGLLQKLLKSADIKCHTIEARAKSIESFEGKVARPGKSYDRLTAITDLAGVRVITYFNDEVDRVASIIDRQFVVDTRRSIDKRLRRPTEFGYSSFHKICGLTKERARLEEYSAYAALMCEVQVRSILQHAWAEIEHDLGYKATDTLPDVSRRAFSRVAALLELADEELTRLRSKLAQVAVEARESIDARRDQELTVVTLAAFIERDAALRAIDRKLAKMQGAKLAPPNGKWLEARVRELRLVGIASTANLSEELDRWGDMAVRVARAMWSQGGGTKRMPKPIPVTQGSGAYWLVWAKAAVQAESTDTAGLLVQLGVKDRDLETTALIRAAVAPSSGKAGGAGHGSKKHAARGRR